MGPEFSKGARKTAVIVIALYGLKSAGVAFRSHLAKCMESLRSDLDSWLKPEVRPEDGIEYYSYLLCCVDDFLCIHGNADSMLEWLPQSFPLKLGFGNPNIYLSAKLHETRLHDGVWA